MFNELLVEIKHLMDDDLGLIEFIINYISIRFSFIPYNQQKTGQHKIYILMGISRSSF